MIPWRFGKRSLQRLAGAAGSLADTGLPWEVDGWLQDRDTLGILDRAGRVPRRYRSEYLQALRDDLHATLRWLSPVGATLFVALYSIDAWRVPDMARGLLWIRVGTATLMAILSLPLLRQRPPRFIFGTGTLLILLPFGVSLFIVGATGGPFSEYLGMMPIFPFLLVTAMPMSMARHLSLVLVMAGAQAWLMAGSPWGWFSQDLGLLINTLSRIGVLALTAMTVAVALRRMRVRNFLRGVAASQEADAADNLLRLILPERAVQQLLKDGTVTPELHNNVTIIFTDFVGFTRIAEGMTGAQLIGELDEIFTQFDLIAHHHGLERIKTIGDAYMAISGLDGSPDHAQRAVEAAEAMVAFLDKRRQDKPDAPNWRIRVGAHSGPVVSGVIGGSRLAFDVWGDTVNVAARMESNSEPGAINVSAATRALLQREDLQHRGEIDAKNIGKMTMFFVRPEHRHTETEHA